MSDPADVLARIAFGLEFLGESSRRVSAYRNGARTLKKLGPRVRSMYDGGELAALAGIGASTLRVVGASLAGEPVSKLDELEAQIPAGIWELRRLRGLGAKKLAQLHKELGIASISELEYACNENRLIALKGFGDKTQAKYLAAIAELRDNAGRWRQDHGMAVLGVLCAALANDDLRVCGDLRRAAETIESLVVVAPGLSANALLTQLTAASGSDPRLTLPQAVDVGGLPGVSLSAAGLPTTVIGCDDLDRLGTHLLLSTGPRTFVEALQKHAAQLGMVWGPAGLFRGGQAIPARDEDAVFEALGLWSVPAERRDVASLTQKTIGRPPRLVALSDICGALHNHTTASDGIHSLAQMQAAAAARGWQYLGISEHSQTAGYAGGLAPEALLEQVKAVARLNETAVGTRVLIGVESDILREGGLDYDDATLSFLDFVVASVHNRFRMEEAEATARMCAAARQPFNDIMGHPTGRLLLGRPATPMDMEALLDACAESGCAVELNSNPQRLDLNAEHLAMAKERGVKVSISPDAHSTVALDHVAYGVWTARRAGLGPEDVLNCFDLQALLHWLTERKRRALTH